MAVVISTKRLVVALPACPGNFPGGGETAAIATVVNPAFTVNNTHVAVTIDSINHIMNLYTNGVLAASATNVNVDLSLVRDAFSFLGRSQWVDPHLNGSIDDFRLYYGVMTPAQVSASFAAGPDPDRLTITLGPAAGHVTVSWPATLVTAGYSLQSSTSVSPASWVAAGAPSLVGGNYQVDLVAGGAAKFFRLIK